MWRGTGIRISIPSSPAILSQDLPVAMAIWNNAISWFETTFYPTDTSHFSFISNPNSTVVTFQAVDPQILQAYCPNAGVNVCTRFSLNTTMRYVVNASVEIRATDLTSSNPSLSLVVAALGTLIGLVEYPAPCPFEDLMCADNLAIYPSTLDLYAARLLAQGQSDATVTLPGGVPFQQAPAPPITFSRTSSPQSTETVTISTTVPTTIPATILVSITNTTTVLAQPQQDYSPLAIATVVAVAIIALAAMFIRRRR